VFEVGPLRLERRDPLGLAVAGRAAGLRHTLVVHPATHPMSVAPSGRSRHLEGPLADTALGSGATFDRLREYSPGDDPRFIHWRSTARTGTLMVRDDIDTSLPTTIVLLDTDEDAYDVAPGGDGAGRAPWSGRVVDAFEAAVEVAASALADAARAGFPASCHLRGAVIETRAGRADLTGCLERLARVTLGPVSGGLGDLVDRLPRTRADSVLVAVSGRADQAEIARLHRIAPRFRRVALVVLSPAGDPSGAAEATGGGSGTSADPGAAPLVEIIRARDAAAACSRWNARGRP
jgi:uncharacterized protein (DUF58 family)